MSRDNEMGVTSMTYAAPQKTGAEQAHRHFTRGPWETCQASVPPYPPAVGDGAGMLICTMNGPPTSVDKMEANAALVAKSPEMFGLLCRLVDHHDRLSSSDPADPYDGVIRDARRLLDEVYEDATGTTPESE